MIYKKILTSFVFVVVARRCCHCRQCLLVHKVKEKDGENGSKQASYKKGLKMIYYSWMVGLVLFVGCCMYVYVCMFVCVEYSSTTKALCIFSVFSWFKC